MLFNGQLEFRYAVKNLCMQQADYSYNVDFDCTRVGIPNPHVVQESTVCGKGYTMNSHKSII